MLNVSMIERGLQYIAPSLLALIDCSPLAPRVRLTCEGTLDWRKRGFSGSSRKCVLHLRLVEPEKTVDPHSGRLGQKIRAKDYGNSEILSPYLSP